MVERLFLITAPRIEMIASCLRRMDEARNRLSDHIRRGCLR